MRVAERECLIADVARFSVSGKSSRIEVVAVIKAVASEDGVFGTHHLIDPDVELIEVIRSCAAIEIVQTRISVRTKTAGRGGQRIEAWQRQPLGRNRIVAITRNDVARERIADNAAIDCSCGPRVVDSSPKDRPAQRIRAQRLRAQVPRKVTTSLLLGWNRCECGVAAPQPEALIPAEEECLVPALIFGKRDGAADRKAELILVERWRDDLARFVSKCRIQVENASRLNSVIAIELVRTAVKFIGSRFRHKVDLPARSLAKFRGVVTGLDFELLENVDGGSKIEQIVELIAVDGAI